MNKPSITPEKWQQVKQVLQSVLELPPERRATYLDRACAGDAALRAEVESLVAAHGQPENVLDEPACELAAGLLSEGPEPSRVGQVISRYQILSLLGSGGMGQVYLAEDTQLDRKVALKLLPAEFTTDRDRARRFVQEAKAASALNHPNILTIYEIGQVAGTHFIAAEFIDGQTLRQQTTSTRLRLDAVLEIAMQVASALRDARGRDRASGHQAGEHHGAARRAGQSLGLRTGQADREAAPALSHWWRGAD